MFNFKKKWDNLLYNNKSFNKIKILLHKINFLLQ